VPALLAGCSLLRTEPSAPFGLLPPASYGGTVSAEQRLSLSRAGTVTTLQAFVDISSEKISVIGATALGARAMTLSYDAAGLHAEGPGASEQVLRDLQLVSWPLRTLQAAMLGSTWRIEEPRPGTRQLWRDDTLATEIHYAGASPWEGRAWLVNLDARYTLAIESRVLH
jgi:hypothetical protein